MLQGQNVVNHPENLVLHQEGLQHTFLDGPGCLSVKSYDLAYPMAVKCLRLRTFTRIRHEMSSVMTGSSCH
jgi:hypothetical protein